MNKQELRFWLITVAVYAVLFVLVAVLTYSCSGPIDGTMDIPGVLWAGNW